jgi:hypothetical protein
MLNWLPDGFVSPGNKKAIVVGWCGLLEVTSDRGGNSPLILRFLPAVI